MEHGAQLNSKLNQTSPKDSIRAGLKVMERVWCDIELGVLKSHARP